MIFPSAFKILIITNVAPLAAALSCTVSDKASAAGVATRAVLMPEIEELNCTVLTTPVGTAARTYDRHVTPFEASQTRMGVAATAEGANVLSRSAMKVGAYASWLTLVIPRPVAANTKVREVSEVVHAVEEVEAAGDVDPDEHAIHEELEVPPFELYWSAAQE